jgi:hypothetical protein
MYYWINKNPPQVHILKQKNPVHASSFPPTPILILSSFLHPGHVSDFIASVFPTKHVYQFILPSTRATCDNCW